MPRHQKDRAWHDIVTLDESWFYFTTDQERIWLPEGTEAPVRERITVQSRKTMMTIVWNPPGFYRTIALSKGMKLNTNYYISHRFDSFAEWRRSQVGASDRRLHAHVDNARYHTVKKVTKFLAGNGMKRAPHPPYSPDLAPWGFYLFEYIKGRLADASFKERDQLLPAIDAIFQFNEKPHWNACFRSGWVDWRGIVWQLVVESKVRKKSEDDPNFT
jgi:histone-lysine N-methyltransferase SETMAR